ncbi:MAG: BatA domain-containing protein [Algisphaera sp.]
MDELSGGSFLIAFFLSAPALAVAGAVAVGLPVLIHLLSRLRHQRVDWGAMRFLRLAYQRQRRRLRFERWLLLLVRCALVALAGLALAGPVFTGALAKWGEGAAGGDGAGPLHVVVDNGITGYAYVSAAGESQTRFDRVRRQAAALSQGASASGRAVRFWPAAPEANGGASQEVASLDAIQQQPIPVNWAATLARVKQAQSHLKASGASSGTVVLLSDWSRGAVWDLAQGADDNGAAVGASARDTTLWVSAPEPGATNVQVQAVRPRRSMVLLGESDAAVGVEVTLRRFGTSLEAHQSTVEVMLKAVGLDVRTTRELHWAAGQASATVALELPIHTSRPGTGVLTAQVQGAASGEVFALDDVRYGLVALRRSFAVTLVDAADEGGLAEGLTGADFVRAALAPGGTNTGAFALTVKDPSVLREAGDWEDTDAVLVLRPDRLIASAWTRLHDFAAAGGVVWVFTPPEAVVSPSTPPEAGTSPSAPPEASVSPSTPPEAAWFASFSRALAPDWSLASALDFTTAPSDSRVSLDASGTPPEALALLLADWSALLAPVRLSGVLPLRVQDSTHAWLQAAGTGDVVLAAARVVGTKDNALGGAVLLLGVAPNPALGSNFAAKPLFPALLHDALRALRKAEGLTTTVLGQADGSTQEMEWEPMALTLPGVEGFAGVLGAYQSVDVTPMRHHVKNVAADASDLRGVSVAELTERLGPWGTVKLLDEQDPGASLRTDAPRWAIGPFLLWVLLGLVLFETWVARRFSHAAQVLKQSGKRAVGGAGCLLLTTLPAAAQDELQNNATPAHGFWDGLLGLESVSVTDAASGLGWTTPLPAWAWLAIVAAAALLAWLAYRRLEGSRAVRSGLAACRALLLFLLAALLAGPQWVRTDETTESDVLAVLVDRSASLTLTDLPATVDEGLSGNGLVSRDEALAEALFRNASLFGPQGLGKDHDVAWWGFGETAVALPGGDPAAWPPPTAPDTRIRTAMEAVLRAHAGRALAGVVLITDGQSPESTGAELVATLNQRGVAVFAVPLGASHPPHDLAIARLEPPDVAFINDAVPVRFVVTSTGGTPGTKASPAALRVRLIDTATDVVLDEQPLEAFGVPVKLMGVGDQAGTRDWAVEITPRHEGDHLADEAGKELNRANNRVAFAVELIDRPLRVLYIESRPRWEYRYLKNMLLRETSIDASVFLLSADDAFAQEGDTPIARLPRDAQEWAAYDVVILGDLPPADLGDTAVTQLRERVSTGGAGLLWVGGEQATPRAWSGSRLEDLLPMRNPDAVGRAPAARFAVAPTPLAEALSVLQWGDQGDLAASTAPLTGRAELRFAQQVGSLKPTAEVLAQAWVQGGEDTKPLALVMQLRYGAGRSVYVATDEMWRLRTGRGDALYERFWVQLVRLLGRSAAGRGLAAVTFEASAARLPVGGTAVFTLHSKDAAVNARGLSSVRVAVCGVDDDAASRYGTLELRLNTRNDSKAMAAAHGTAWQGTWRSTSGLPAAVELRVVEPALADLNLRVPLNIDVPADELRAVAADRDRLLALAQATDGALIELDALADLGHPGRVPNLARTQANDVREPLSRAPLVLGLILLLVAVEWIGRRAMHLA